MSNDYYNENDPRAAEWLRNLIMLGVIPAGEVDERSIEDVFPADLKGYRRCHFFTGIGVWAYALQEAGWPGDLEVWTGSCPCQPFSAAGKRAGASDERHLWPAFNHLIEVRRPRVVLGEQVASKDGLAWLDLVSSDMEAKDYAFAALDLCAASFGAPHIRQRLYWMADANGGNPGSEWQHGQQPQDGMAGRMADADDEGPQGRGQPEHQRTAQLTAGPGSLAGRMADAEYPERGPQCEVNGDAHGWNGPGRSGDTGGPGPTNGFWGAADWLGCRDGKWRPVEPGTFPLVDGSPNRVGRLRGYGNALVAPQAIEFVKAVLCALR